MSGESTAGKRILIYDFSSGKTLETSTVVRPDFEWEKLCPPDVFRIARCRDTEPAFTGKYYDCHRAGLYRCACCRTDLFSSEKKYDSGTGWPSFTAPVSELNIVKERDNSFGMERTEVLCARCEAHLGHLFPDGPPPDRNRYCINSASLVFVPVKKEVV